MDLEQDATDVDDVEVEQSEDAELQTEVEQSEDEGDKPESKENTDEVAEEQPEEEQDDELVITLGDEPAPEPEERAPEWVRELRRQNREQQREIAELRKLKQAAEKSEELSLAPGKKPTLDDPDIDFDADKLAEKLEKWFERKQAYEAAQKLKAEAEAKQREAFDKTMSAYRKAAESLKVRDYSEAEAQVLEKLGETKMGIIVGGLKKSPELAAQLVYALHANPKKTQELADMQDPVEYAVAVGELKTMLKVAPRKAPPPPERGVRGSSGSIGGAASASNLEKLREKARQSGDYTAYFAAKNAAKK